ncbi:unnamed protein product [Prorocentrum cordatum]|uniref:Uncharacterized protein n=1 Tax=Prorocentrum cordatum TaxID=2364126 RepID=A0ABN9QAV0_9DINO|nr:unnamed protein product [Polarella glacialis]
MGGKGKGRGGPPPPPPPAAPSGGEAPWQQQKRERTERERRDALEAIARAKELEARKRDLESRLPALRGHDIASVPWDSALLGTHLCGGKGADGLNGLSVGGAGGVDVVELAGGTAVCVRSGPSVVTEIIADALAAALGVRVARMRLVLAGSEECRAIHEASKRWRSAGIEQEMAQIEQKLDTVDAEAAARLRGDAPARHVRRARVRARRLAGHRGGGAARPLAGPARGPGPPLRPGPAPQQHSIIELWTASRFPAGAPPVTSPTPSSQLPVILPPKAGESHQARA